MYRLPWTTGTNYAVNHAGHYRSFIRFRGKGMVIHLSRNSKNSCVRMLRAGKQTHNDVFKRLKYIKTNIKTSYFIHRTSLQWNFMFKNFNHYFGALFFVIVFKLKSIIDISCNLYFAEWYHIRFQNQNNAGNLKFKSKLLANYFEKMSSSSSKTNQDAADKPFSSSSQTL